MGLSTIASTLWKLYRDELPDPPMMMATYIMNHLESAGYTIVEIKKEGTPITEMPSVASQEPSTSS